MNKFTQHIPNYIDTNREPTKIEFDSTEQLLTHNLFTQWQDENFIRFEYAVVIKAIVVIVKGRNEKIEWWVLGYTEETINDLPIFDRDKYKK